MKLFNDKSGETLLLSKCMLWNMIICLVWNMIICLVYRKNAMGLEIFFISIEACLPYRLVMVVCEKVVVKLKWI